MNNQGNQMPSFNKPFYMQSSDNYQMRNFNMGSDRSEYMSPLFSMNGDQNNDKYYDQFYRRPSQGSMNPYSQQNIPLRQMGPVDMNFGYGHPRNFNGDGMMRRPMGGADSMMMRRGNLPMNPDNGSFMVQDCPPFMNGSNIRKAGPMPSRKRNAAQAFPAKKGDFQKNGGKKPNIGKKAPPITAAQKLERAIHGMMCYGVNEKFLRKLPKEIMENFEPLICKMCNASLNSDMNAHVHYTSKKHLKKVHLWLEDWSQRSGKPIPADIVAHIQLQDVQKSRESCCELCDVVFTSTINASSHYNGKQHKAVVDGRRLPKIANTRGENATKIQQLLARERTLMSKAKAEVGNIAGTPVVQDALAPLSARTPADMYCTTCDIAVTCREQLVSHKNGKKHLQKEKLMMEKNAATEIEIHWKDDPFAKPQEESDPVEENEAELMEELKEEVKEEPKEEPQDSLPEDDVQNDEGVTEDSILAAVAFVKNEDCTFEDLSQYRMPSGGFYCGSCSVSITADFQMRTHLQSRRHLRAITMSK